MNASEPIFDVVLRVCMEQARNPDRFGGGMIGRAVAVLDALSLDGDRPLSSLKQDRVSPWADRCKRSEAERDRLRDALRSIERDSVSSDLWLRQKAHDALA